jgi:hypothetical protein
MSVVFTPKDTMRQSVPLLLIAVICLLSGQLGSRCQLRREGRNNVEKLDSTLAVHAFNDVGPTVSSLEDLRVGNTNSAILRLESKLHTDVCDMWYFYKHHPARALEAPQRELLGNIRAYKRKYPGDTDDPSTDQLVVEILFMTNAPTGK